MSQRVHLVLDDDIVQELDALCATLRETRSTVMRLALRCGVKELTRKFKPRTSRAKNEKK